MIDAGNLKLLFVSYDYLEFCQKDGGEVKWIVGGILMFLFGELNFFVKFIGKVKAPRGS